MPDITYPAIYRDQYGEESILIHNNGQEMRTTIRGVEVVTDWFFDDDFELPNLQEPYPLLALLPNDKGQWWHLSCVIPIQVVTNEGEKTADLHIELNIGVNDVPELGLFTGLTLVLEVGEKRYRARKELYFDELLQKIQQSLPEGWHIKSCIHCRWGASQPGGGPAFGAMGCFRDNRERLEWARSFSYQKPYMFQIWKEKTQWVQEIYLCDEFEPTS